MLLDESRRVKDLLLVATDADRYGASKGLKRTATFFYTYDANGNRAAQTSKEGNGGIAAENGIVTLNGIMGCGFARSVLYTKHDATPWIVV